MSTYLWVVVIKKVQVDPQLPHALKRISEPQTKNEKAKTTKVQPPSKTPHFPHIFQTSSLKWGDRKVKVGVLFSIYRTHLSSQLLS